MTLAHAAALAVLDRITKGDWRWSDQYADTKGQRTWSLLGKGGYGILSCDGTANSPQGLGDVANARAIAALPELAALYRAGVDLDAAIKEPLPQDATPGQLSDFAVRCVRVNENFRAALAAVADKLNGEGK